MITEVQSSEIANIVLVKDNDEITALVYDRGYPTETRIKLGQRVQSNGRYLLPKGRWGNVVELFAPFQGGLTSNCIRVVWDEGPTGNMKIRELIL